MLLMTLRRASSGLVVRNRVQAAIIMVSFASLGWAGNLTFRANPPLIAMNTAAIALALVALWRARIEVDSEAWTEYKWLRSHRIPAEEIVGWRVAEAGVFSKVIQVVNAEGYVEPLHSVYFFRRSAVERVAQDLLETGYARLSDDPC